ncbi:MAG TPA: hypothetical protein VH328_06195 [Burkholderiaceae bacterium]|nr:hypothetical protein [Burkholderiaceae bacterium]
MANLQQMHLKQVLTLSLAGLVTVLPAIAYADTSSVASDQFASGWQQHVTSLINHGPGPGASATTIWYVPGNVPKGHYYVVAREGDRARVIDGYAVTVTSSAGRDIHLVLPQAYGDVQILPSSDVPGAHDSNAKVRFEGP